jgi:hypothetical protein
MSSVLLALAVVRELGGRRLSAVAVHSAHHLGHDQMFEYYMEHKLTAPGCL